MSDSHSSVFEIVGERIRGARLQSGLTQEEVAHAAGVNVSYYGKLERGLNNPTLDTLVRICAVTGAKLSQLVVGLEAVQLPERPAWPRRGPRQ